MAIIGAFTHAPKHSTSEIVNNLSFVVSPTLIPSFFCTKPKIRKNNVMI